MYSLKVPFLGSIVQLHSGFVPPNNVFLPNNSVCLPSGNLPSVVVLFPDNVLFCGSVLGHIDSRYDFSPYPIEQYLFDLVAVK